MDDSNIWYYLVLGLIYFISKAFGKKKKKPGIPPAQSTNQPSPQQEAPIPDLSFDELLQELTGQKSKKPKPAPEPIQVEEVREVSFEPSVPTYSTDEMDAIAAKPFGYDSSKPSLKSKQKVYSHQLSTSFERDQKYKIEEYDPFDFTEILEKDNGPAQAFVLQEIFARKF